MTFSVIEINDYQLTITGQDNSYHQSGYALITEDNVIFGDDAYLKAKISPTNVHCHYWHRLGYEKITSINSQVRHFADLAYLQLKSLLAQATPCPQVVFVVPSIYTPQQLSLLLGIAQSCQLEVIGLVNGPLLRLADCRSHGTYAVLDIGLHHCDYSQLVADQDICLERSQQFANKGIDNLYNHLAQWLNQRFMTECRFDTFHLAETEQCLYEQLPNMLLKNADSYDIRVTDKAIKIHIEELNQQIEYFFQVLINTVADVSQGYISQRFAAILFGLPIYNCLSRLNPSLTYALVNNNINSISASSFSNTTGVSLVTRLPAEISPPDKRPTRVNDISHIVCNGQAYPLDNRELFLSDSGARQITLDADAATSVVLTPVNGVWQLNLANNKRVLVNERPATSGQFVSRGDQVSLGHPTTLFTLIKVEKEL